MATHAWRRVDSLDGLRSIAVLQVFLHHAWEKEFVGGWIGVNLFFVLSGFLITSILLSEWQTLGRIDLRKFYIRRALRLSPALIAMVAVVTPFAVWLQIGSPWIEAISAVTYTMDIYAPATLSTGGAFGHTWSLAVEEQFYLIWPIILLVVLTKRRLLSATALTLAALSTLASGILFDFVSTSGLYRSPIPHVAGLLIGATFAALLTSGSLRTVQRIPHWLACGIFVCLLVATPVLDQNSAWLYRGGILGLSAMFGVLIVQLATDAGGGLAKFLRVRPLVWLGQRSYGFYLWHFPMLAIVQQLLNTESASTVIALVATLGVTALSWRILEEPILRLKRRYEPTLELKSL